jgi:hypothetical protein
MKEDTKEKVIEYLQHLIEDIRIGDAFDLRVGVTRHFHQYSLDGMTIKHIPLDAYTVQLDYWKKEI